MEDRCICCGSIIPEGRQVCKLCEVMNMNMEGYKDPTAEQALWGIRKEERIRWLEKKYNCYRGEKYKIKIDNADGTGERASKKIRTCKVVRIYEHFVTVEYGCGIWESFRWADFEKRKVKTNGHQRTKRD